MTRRFVLAALLLAGAYGAAHLAGLRDHTGVLSGTAGSAALGVAYVLLHFGFVLGTPVLLLAAAIDAAVRRLLLPRDAARDG